MPYRICLISLGCAKNQVNSEQMLYLLNQAGHEVVGEVDGCDVAIVNTCGFIDSAKSEAIDQILQLAEVKKAGGLKKILVTGCLSQRYENDILESLPEVDGMLGTGSFGQICAAVEDVMHDGKPLYFDDMVAGLAPGDRYLRIADRAEAIRTAAMLAKPGDILLLAGKGHETYQIVGDVKNHFDDKEEALRAFALYAKN